eukprot:1207428-Prymnesium_polylepis.1
MRRRQVPSGMVCQFLVTSLRCGTPPASEGDSPMSRCVRAESRGISGAPSRKPPVLTPSASRRVARCSCRPSTVRLPPSMVSSDQISGGAGDWLSEAGTWLSCPAAKLDTPHTP